LGIYALSRSRVTKRYPSAMMKCCVIPIVLTMLSITLENPEVEVHHHEILGDTRRTIQHVFGWLEHTVSAAEFDAILTAASKTQNATGMSDTALFPMGCVAQELEHAAPNVINIRCHQHADFFFQLDPWACIPTVDNSAFWDDLLVLYCKLVVVSTFKHTRAPCTQCTILELVPS